MNKFHVFSLIPAGVVSALFFKGFFIMTSDKQAEEPVPEAVVKQAFTSGDIGDDCDWIAIDLDSGACFANPTSSFGPPDKMYLAIKGEKALVSSSEQLDSGFCSSIASLESAVAGVSELQNGKSQIPVRWVCPLLNQGV